MNLFESNTIGNEEFKFSWLNEPDNWEIKNCGLRVFAPPSSDYFIDEEGPSVRDSAPFYYVKAKGDFRMTTRVTVDMNFTYDSACLMIMDNPENWAKLCYENWQDIPAIVSVVTQGMSDDCPSYEIGRVSPYLRVVRSGNCFGFHYSLDGEQWRIIRYFNMKMSDSIRVGVASQCPIGEGCKIDFEFLELELGKVVSAKEAT